MSGEYRLDECSACQAQNVPVRHYEDMGIGTVTVDLCDLCAATPSGNAAMYPSNPCSDADVLRTICFVGNEILKELRKR